MKKKFLRFLAEYLTGSLVTLLCRTLRVRTEYGEGSEELMNSGGKYVAAFWHGTMLYPWRYFGYKEFAALVSQSKDGGILANVLKKWNYEVIRGSSHIGGKEAFNELVAKGKDGYSIAITPDGPTGPPYKMKAGAVVAAKKNAMPLILVGAGYEKKYVLRSWDKFQVPKPFSKVKLVFSSPVFVDSGLTREETSAVIEEAEKELMDLQNKAEHIV